LAAKKAEVSRAAAEAGQPPPETAITAEPAMKWTRWNGGKDGSVPTAA